jgi:hypothetical protein
VCGVGWGRGWGMKASQKREKHNNCLRNFFLVPIISFSARGGCGYGWDSFEFFPLFDARVRGSWARSSRLCSLGRPLGGTKRHPLRVRGQEVAQTICVTDI